MVRTLQSRLSWRECAHRVELPRITCTPMPTNSREHARIIQIIPLIVSTGRPTASMLHRRVSPYPRLERVYTAKGYGGESRRAAVRDIHPALTLGLPVS